MGSVSHQEEPVAAAPHGAQSPMGRYGPQVSITRFDTAPRELEWQLPLEGELYRLIPGPDRPDYSLLVLERPLHFYPGAGFDLDRVEPEQRVEDRKGRPMVRVHALLVCSRFVGQQLQPGMHDLAVNIAYVIDNSLARDAVVDFSKIEVAAVGFISEGHVTPSGEGLASPGAADADAGVDARADADADAPAATVVTEAPAAAATAVAPDRPDSDAPTAGADTADDVVAEAARTLRDGVAAHRGRPVARLTATLVVGPDHRLAGLSGNADGEAPVPTPETFEQLNAILARLGELGEGSQVGPEAGTDPDAPAGATPPEGGADAMRRFTVRVEGDSVVLENSPEVSA